MRVLLEKVVLNLPDVVVAESVGQLDLLERVSHQPVLGALCLPGPRVLVLVEDPEPHARSVPSSLNSAPRTADTATEMATERRALHGVRQRTAERLRDNGARSTDTSSEREALTRVAAAAAGAHSLEDVLELAAEQARAAVGAASLSVSRWERDSSL